MGNGVGNAQNCVRAERDVPVHIKGVTTRDPTAGSATRMEASLHAHANEGPVVAPLEVTHPECSSVVVA